MFIISSSRILCTKVTPLSGAMDPIILFRCKKLNRTATAKNTDASCAFTGKISKYKRYETPLSFEMRLSSCTKVGKPKLPKALYSLQ
jgi:hypothetical protein